MAQHAQLRINTGLAVYFCDPHSPWQRGRPRLGLERGVHTVIEQFWARMRVELLNRRRCSARLELSNAILASLEVVQNRQRRHKPVGMLAPVEYELCHATTARDQAS